MTFEAAQRLTEILLALAFLQQSLEHLAGPKDEQRLFALRIVLSGLLLSGVFSPWALHSIAARSPAPPAPMTTTSCSIVWISRTFTSPPTC